MPPKLFELPVHEYVAGTAARRLDRCPSFARHDTTERGCAAVAVRSLRRVGSTVEPLELLSVRRSRCERHSSYSPPLRVSQVFKSKFFLLSGFDARSFNRDSFERAPDLAKSLSEVTGLGHPRSGRARG